MSVSEWKAREKEQRRNDIIDAAEKLFFSRGYESVSMDDIAKEIKLNKATLYRYFMSKEALFFTVVLRGVRIHSEMLVSGLKGGGSGLDRLIAIGDISLAFSQQYPDYHKLLSYYISGRFDLGRLAKSDDLACVVSDEYRELAGISGAVGGEKADGVGRLVNSGDVSYPPSNQYRKWVKLAETTESEVVQEISRLRWEMFEAMRSSIKAGQEDGSIQSGIGPGELAVFIGIISSGINSLSPDYRCLLEYMGIDGDQFAADSRAFLRRVIAKKPGKS